MARNWTLPLPALSSGRREGVHSALESRVWMTNLHVAIRMIERVEAELFVEFLRVLRDQHPTPNPLQFRVSEDSPDQALAQTTSAKWLENNHVRQISIRRVIGDCAREANLLLATVNTESQRIPYCFAHHFTRTRPSPILLLKNLANFFQVEPGGISADRKLVRPRLNVP